MKITDRIDGYENLSIEEKLKALEEMDYSEPAHKDDASTIKLKEALNKASAEVAEYKRKFKERQTEEERKESERIEAEKAKDELIASLQRDKALSELTKGFSKAGAKAVELAEAFMEKDTNVFVDAFSKFLDEHDKELAAEALRNTPRPRRSNGTNPTITKEQFEKMGYSERAKVFEENPELYKELTE